MYIVICNSVGICVHNICKSLYECVYVCMYVLQFTIRLNSIKKSRSMFVNNVYRYSI